MIWDILEESTFNNYFSSPQIETLSVQTLLLDENIITQFKNMNPQLIDYVTQHKQQFIEKLIEYTITLPSENDSEDRMKKLPYVSSQLLAIDNQIIYNSLLNNGAQKDYFLELMKLFATESCKNQILMGYFLKIITNLYKCQKYQTVKKIYSSRQTLYQHLNDESVGAILQMLIILLQTQEGFMLTQRKEVITKLIQLLIQDKQPTKNVCKNILVEVISKFQTFSSGDQLKDHIVNSQQLLKIFTISNSQAIDKFIIGYLTKALQKICTAGDQKKSLLEIPEIHKQKIAQFINLKKDLLSNNNTGQSFKNQSKQYVHRFSKQLSTYLTIIKLALQNSITGFLNQQDILCLFDILAKHPTNDIVKVKIFDIFSFVFLKKDQKAQNILSDSFYQQSIRLFQKDSQMYGYFLFTLWKSVNKKIKNPPSQTQINQWNQLRKYFQSMENHQKQAQKVVDRYSNRTKVVKLVVDQEDTTPSISTSQNQPQTSQKVSIQQPEKQTKKPEVEKQIKKQVKLQTKIPVAKFDVFSPVTTFPSKNQNKNDPVNKLKADPFAGFGFFGVPAVKKESKEQEKKQEKKKADFSSFASFF